MAGERRMSQSTSNMMTVGSAVTVLAAVLTFWVAASQQVSRVADTVTEVRQSVDQLRTTAQGTRDAVMVLSGKVDGLTATIDRNTSFLEALDERVRAIETDRRDK